MQFALTERTQPLLLWGICLAVFWVIFLWGFFERGPYALGINAAVFLLLALGLLGNVFPAERPMWSKQQWAWLVPLVLIAVSGQKRTLMTTVTRIIAIPQLRVNW